MRIFKIIRWTFYPHENSQNCCHQTRFLGSEYIKIFVCAPDPAGGADSAPSPLAGFKRPALRQGRREGKGSRGGNEGEGKGTGKEGRGKEGREKKGREKKGREGVVKRWRMVPQLLDCDCAYDYVI